MLTVNGKKHNNFFSFWELINQDYIGLHMYYNVVTEDFEPHKLDSVDDSDLILTPCAYRMKRAIWKEFYSSLDSKEDEVAKSYTYTDGGFFEYMRETGLEGKYRAAEEAVIVKAFKTWCETNNLDINIEL